MSFSSLVKKELCGVYGAEHCAAAEIAAIVSVCGTVNASNIRIQTENAAVAKKYFRLIKKQFKLQGDVSIRNSRQFSRSRVYSVSTPIIEKILNAEKKGGFNRECCKRAYIRGAFLSGGSLSDPEKAYHLEFVNADRQKSEYLADIIHSFGLKARIIERKAHYIVYLKEGENIVDLLNIMGAHLSLMNLENTRIVKDMRNNVNRQVNCETANLSKTVRASVKQINDINTIARIKGLGYLSDQLEDVAELRLMYEEASLKEIGAMLSPPVGKSGVNHRLRKISEIAENLRGGFYD
ncbi:MAG: DNA-binding protein WhiA [Clostridiales bacterium]|nr:DNA-binding protein WhiA [Clostridiales bacterium]